MTVKGQEESGPGNESVSGLTFARIFAIGTCLVLLSVAAAAGLVGVLREARDLPRQRALYATLTDEQRSRYVSDAFDVPPAFHRFRAVLRKGDRFALVVPNSESERASLYRAFGLYFLYPHIAAGDLAHADAVLVLGTVPSDVNTGFVEIASEAGAWIGRRR